MAPISPGLFSFNSGVISKLGLARVDLAKARVAGEVQQNLTPMIMGPAMFRPGLQYLDRTISDEVPELLPFVYDDVSAAVLVLSASGVQFLVNDVFLTRPSVSAAITNGGFTSNITGWTGADEAGAASAWATGGYLSLTGNGTNYAIRKQTVTVSNVGTEHALRVIIARGPVTILVGSADGLDDYVATKTLNTGEHSLAFTPSGNFYLRFQANDTVPKLVDSVAIEASGRVTLTNPWAASLDKIRYDKSGAIMFMACDGVDPRRVRLIKSDMRSWGIELYQTADGPFNFANTTPTTITPSAVTGAISLTASRALFMAGHVGSIWRLTHGGQTATATLSSDNVFSSYVRVTGLSKGSGGGNQRFFTVTITGTFSGTVTLQRSFAEPGAWTDYDSYTGPTSTTVNDGLDNQIVYYRLGIKTGGYTSGTVTVTLTYANAIQKGVVRITAITDSTHASADVLSTLGAVTSTSQWEEGVWSTYRGFPSAVALHDGRLWWGFGDTVYGSVSDAYDSYDDQIDGDSGPVVRSIATGPVSGIRWLMSLQRFLAGTAAEEVSMRASSIDEPITPTQFTARSFATRGCADVQPVTVDNQGAYVQRSMRQLMIAFFDGQVLDYQSRDTTRLVPEICEAGIKQLTVQRQPDTAISAVLADGTEAVLTYEPQDDVMAWTTLITDGLIKSRAVLPGNGDDKVYYAVKRSPTGGDVVTIEKQAKREEARPGAALCKVMDSFVVYSGTPTTTITGLSHLNGKSVAVRADGKPVNRLYPVSGGAITLDTAASNVVVGLPYDGKFKSAKLAYGAVAGTALSKKKRISKVGLLMSDVDWYGVRVGRSFNDMNHLPPTLNSGRPLDPTEALEDYDCDLTTFNGGWGPDERLCFQVSSPYAATFMGAVLQMEANEPQIYGRTGGGPSVQGGDQ